MSAKEKIIVAVDVPTITQARSLVCKLAPHVGGFKFGLEMLTAEKPERLVDMVLTYGGKIFIDGKFHDIPSTVAGAIRSAVRREVLMFNVHCLGGRTMMKTARETAEKVALKHDIPRPLVLGVTLLTSLSYDDLVDLLVIPPVHKLSFSLEKEEELKCEQVTAYVKHLAELAQESGLDGVVCSSREAASVRKHCGEKFLIVTPGIRRHRDAVDDQKRTMTPFDAVKAGSDYLVIGRPITKAPSPIDMAEMIADEIRLAMVSP